MGNDWLMGRCASSVWVLLCTPPGVSLSTRGLPLWPQGCLPPCLWASGVPALCKSTCWYSLSASYLHLKSLFCCSASCCPPLETRGLEASKQTLPGGNCQTCLLLATITCHDCWHMYHYWLIPQEALCDLTGMMSQEVAAMLGIGLCLGFWQAGEPEAWCEDCHCGLKSFLAL